MNPPHYATRLKVTGSGLQYQKFHVDKHGLASRVMTAKDQEGKSHHFRVGPHRPKLALASSSENSKASKEKVMKNIGSALRGMGISSF